MSQSVLKPKILILSQKPTDSIFLTKICSHIGTVYTATVVRDALEFLKAETIHTLVVDHALADFTSFQSSLGTYTSIVITGRDRKNIEECAREWPLDLHVDFLPIPTDALESSGFRRAVNTAVQHSFMKSKLNHFQNSLTHKDSTLSHAYTEIQEIKKFIEGNVINELEKRISLQSKYMQFKKEKQSIERIIKKLHTANDVTSLLDIIYDAKEIVKARGISMYLIEHSETQGVFLKPLVWNNSIISHPDYSKFSVMANSQDLAALVVRNGLGVNSSQYTIDKGLIQRYVNQLDYSLDSILSIPLKHENKVIGVIEVYNKQWDSEPPQKGFSKEDQNLMQLLSEHIAIAITNLNLIQHDALTGLLRPDPFFEMIINKLTLEKKRRMEDSSYALVMGDVDWFKFFNDRNGHEEGNRLLRELAWVLKSSIREDDLLCRYGGEEFLFFLSKIEDLDEACRLTERIRKNVEEHYFNHQEFQPKNNLTMSFGVTAFTRDELTDIDSLTPTELKKIVIEADMALSEAKSKKTSADQMTVDKNRVSAYQGDTEGKDKLIKDYQEKVLHEKRKDKRYSTSALLVYKTEQTPEITRTINLSLGGAKIPTKAPLNSTQTVDLILILGDTACQIKGSVVYTTQVNGHDPKFHSGLKFKDMSLTDMEKIEEYFASLAVEPNQTDH